jgi:hypothetical protein
MTLYYSFGGGGLLGDDAGGVAAHTSATEVREGSQTIREAPELPAGTPEFPALSDANVDALPWQAPDTREAFGTRAVEIAGVCFRRHDGSPEPIVEQGGWLEVLVRARAIGDAPACNLGMAVHDRHNRLLFARGWVNAGLSPLDLHAGARVVCRFALKLDLEPGEYVVSLAASQAIPDASSPIGWNQHVGGERYCELPHAAKVAVVPGASRARSSFGPANLRSRVDGVVTAGQ